MHVPMSVDPSNGTPLITLSKQPCLSKDTLNVE